MLVILAEPSEHRRTPGLEMGHHARGQEEDRGHAHILRLQEPGRFRCVSSKSTHFAHRLTLLGMYTFNDHYGYGLAEMVENLVSIILHCSVSSVLTTNPQLLDFSKARTPQEQWVIIETMAHWMSSADIQPFNRELKRWACLCGYQRS